MTTRQITYITTAAVVAFVIALDLFMLSRGKPTVSIAVYSEAKNHPIVAVAVGILIGHLFWPQG